MSFPRINEYARRLRNILSINELRVFWQYAQRGLPLPQARAHSLARRLTQAQLTKFIDENIDHAKNSNPQTSPIVNFYQQILGQLSYIIQLWEQYNRNYFDVLKLKTQVGVHLTIPKMMDGSVGRVYPEQISAEDQRRYSVLSNADTEVDLRDFMSITGIVRILRQYHNAFLRFLSNPHREMGDDSSNVVIWGQRIYGVLSYEQVYVRLYAVLKDLDPELRLWKIIRNSWNQQIRLSRRIYVAQYTEARRFRYLPPRKFETTMAEWKTTGRKPLNMTSFISNLTYRQLIDFYIMILENHGQNYAGSNQIFSNTNRYFIAWFRHRRRRNILQNYRERELTQNEMDILTGKNVYDYYDRDDTSRSSPPVNRPVEATETWQTIVTMQLKQFVEYLLTAQALHFIAGGPLFDKFKIYWNLWLAHKIIVRRLNPNPNTLQRFLQMVRTASNQFQTQVRSQCNPSADPATSKLCDFFHFPMRRDSLNQMEATYNSYEMFEHPYKPLQSMSSKAMFSCEKMPLGNFAISAFIKGKAHFVRTKTYQICGSSQVMQSELCDKAMRSGSEEDAMRAVEFARLEDAFLMIELKQSCMGKKKATKYEIEKSRELSRKIGELLGEVPMYHKVHLNAIADPLNSTAPASGMTNEAKMCSLVTESASLNYIEAAYSDTTDEMFEHPYKPLQSMYA